MSEPGALATGPRRLIRLISLLDPVATARGSDTQLADGKKVPLSCYS